MLKYKAQNLNWSLTLASQSLPDFHYQHSRQEANHKYGQKLNGSNRFIAFYPGIITDR